MKKTYFNKRFEVRLSEELVKKMNEILDIDPNIENRSHLIRCAIIHFYNNRFKR